MRKGEGKVEATICLPGMLANLADGKRQVTIEAGTLQELIDALVARYPLLEVHVFAEGRQIRQHVNIFYNKASLKQLDDWRIPLQTGDTVMVLQAVSGG